MKRYLLLCGIGLHFWIILWSNLNSTVYVLCKAKGEAKPILSAILSRGNYLLQHPIFLLYSKLSGAETAFGFFAPNVGGQYITTFVLYDEDGVVLDSMASPGLYRAESLNRYSSFTRVFEALTPHQNKDDFASNYAKAIAHNMAYRLAKRNPVAKSIRVRIFLHRSPIKNVVTRQRHILLYEKHLHLN